MKLRGGEQGDPPIELSESVVSQIQSSDTLICHIQQSRRPSVSADNVPACRHEITEESTHCQLDWGRLVHVQR